MIKFKEFAHELEQMKEIKKMLNTLKKIREEPNKKIKEMPTESEQMKEIKKMLNKLRKIRKELNKKIKEMPTESKKINKIILEPDGIFITEQCTIGTTNPAKVLDIYEGQLHMILTLSDLTLESPSKSDYEKIWCIRRDIKDLAPNTLLSIFSDPSVTYIKK